MLQQHILMSHPCVATVISQIIYITQIWTEKAHNYIYNGENIQEKYDDFLVAAQLQTEMWIFHKWNVKAEKVGNDWVNSYEKNFNGIGWQDC